MAVSINTSKKLTENQEQQIDLLWNEVYPPLCQNKVIKHKRGILMFPSDFSELGSVGMTKMQKAIVL